MPQQCPYNLHYTPHTIVPDSTIIQEVVVLSALPWNTLQVHLCIVLNDDKGWQLNSKLLHYLVPIEMLVGKQQMQQ